MSENWIWVQWNKYSREKKDPVEWRGGKKSHLSVTAAISLSVFVQGDPSPFILPSSWRCGPPQQSLASQSPHTAGHGRPSPHSSWTGWRGPWKSIPAHRNTWTLRVYILQRHKVSSGLYGQKKTVVLKLADCTWIYRQCFYVFPYLL